MALLTAVVSGLTLVAGLLNNLFDWDLGLAIGGFDIGLPQDFSVTVALAVALLLVAGFFELVGNFKKARAKIRTHPLRFTLLLLVMIGVSAGGLYSLAGGALGTAVEKGDSEKVRALLSEKEYSPSVLGDYLYQTLKRGDLTTSQLLLDGGADPNRVSGEFQTPLLAGACIYFPPESVFWLLENGADPNLKDSMGRTPAFNLLQYRSSHFPNVAEQVDILERLKDAGANFDLKANGGKSARTLGKEKSSEEIKAFFSVEGGPPDQKGG